MKIGQTYQHNSTQFNSVIDSVNGWGDAFMRTIKYYTPSDQSLTEEFDRDNGTPQGCADLTWSYASILTSAFQRAKTRNNKKFVQGLANLGYTENS